MLSDLFLDIRYSLRALGRSPGFTAVVVIALALGIGANTAVFSVFNGVLLNPLPYPEPHRLVWLWPADARTGQSFSGATSPPDFVDYRKQATVFTKLSAFLQMDLTLSGNGAPERVPAAGVSNGFFETLGVRPVLGRSIRAEDEQTGWPQVAILSDGLWQRRFGSDASVVGKTIDIDGKNVTVIGVMPAGFEFPKEAQLWQPLPFGYEELKVRRFHFLRIIGRLKPGVTLGQADAEMKTICARLARIYPDSNENYSSTLVSLLDELVGSLRPTLIALLVAVGFVLLIACTNVAHLLLARAAARQKEIAIRSSLGASTGRVMRQMMTESALLAILGGALGVILAVWGLKALIALHPANLPRLDEVHLDFRVLAFTAALSIFTGLLFGLAPALRASRPDLTESLKDGYGGSAGRAHRRFHNVLVMAEVALAMMLLSGAGLMIRSFQRLSNVNPGFNPKGVMVARIALPMQPGLGDKVGKREIGFYRPLLEKLKAQPGVEYAGLVSELPLAAQGNDTSFTIDGRPAVRPVDRPHADDRNVSADYFKAMSIPLIAGRYFKESDNENNANVAIVSRSLAEKYFAGQSALGEHLSIDHGFSFRCEIIGVVGDVLHRSLAGDASPTVYVPYTQAPGLRSNVVIKTRTNPLAMAGALKDQVQALDPNVPVFGIHAMDYFISDSVERPRFRTMLLGVFAGIALLLAAAGIYGVMSYSVTLRMHELGIRAALGAGRKELLMATAGPGMMWAGTGIATGLAGAMGLGRLIADMLYGLRPSDPVSFSAVSILLLLVSFLASILPARRAAKVDAMVALRHE